MAPFHVPLLVVLLLPLVPLLPAAASSSSSHHNLPASAHAHVHRHRSLTTTATARIIPAPSMHRNHFGLEESQSLHVLDHPFTPVAAQAPSGEEAMATIGAAATAAEPTRLDQPQAPSPPPSFDPAADQTSPTPPQPRAKVQWSASGVAATPPLDEPVPSTTTLPLPHPPYYNAGATPSVPVHASGEATVASVDDLGLPQLAKVLTSLGYNEMASAATLLADSPPVAGWSGAITVFAAPDVFLQASCPGCSRRRLFLEHIALGYFPFSELAAAPTVKLPSASVGFCLNVAPEPGPFVVNHVSLYVDGVEISYPELYNDGKYVVHGLHGFVPPLSHTSCSYEAEQHHHRRHHLTARSAATSAATAASVVRIMIRDAISRLRDGGFGFVSLAMRVKFAELEKFSNLTVFAVDDQAIFTGGGQDYVSSVRFHVVPGHRLTHANLLRLRPGTKLPTLTGEYHQLVITHGAGSGSDEVRINYIPVKEPDVVVNSRVAVHGIYVPFPRLHLPSLASSLAAASSIQMNSSCVVRGPFGGCASTATTSSASIPAAHFYGEGQ